MNNTNTGGPAFPQHGFDPITERFTSQGGMTLRDYFAAKAMQSMIRYGPWAGDDEDMERIADLAYKQAGAMLKAREA
jgi:hypothetical protein